MLASSISWLVTCNKEYLQKVINLMLNIAMKKNLIKIKIIYIKFYTRLSFKIHSSSLWKKACQKLHVFTRTLNYIGLKKR